VLPNKPYVTGSCITTAVINIEVTLNRKTELGQMKITSCTLLAAWII